MPAHITVRTRDGRDCGALGEVARGAAWTSFAIPPILDSDASAITEA